MIRVAIVHHSLRRGGGSEQVVYDWVSELDRTKFEPILCCLYEPGELGEELRQLGIPVYSNLSAFPLDVRSLFRLRTILRRRQIDLLYTTDGFANMIVGRLSAALAGTPASVLAFHTYDTIIRQGTRPLRRAALEAADRVFHPTMDGYIALAPSHKTYLITEKRLRPDKIAVVPNGIDLAAFEGPVDRPAARQRFGIQEDEQVVSMVAGLRPWKNHAMLVRAAAQIVAQIPNAVLVLAGDGPERSRLEELAVEYGLQDRIRFLGVIADVPALLAASDLCVLTSRHEAFPLSLLEAMAAGRPVVATAAGSVADLVLDGVTGLLVAVGDTEAFADAVVRVLADPTVGDQLGRAGRRRVEEEFTRAQMVERTEALFAAIVDEARPRRVG